MSQQRAKFAVMGATGNIGQKLVTSLASAGYQVRAIGRSQERLAALSKLGAEAVVGDAEDLAFLTKAFTGVDAVFAMIPPQYQAASFRGYQNLVGDVIARAIQAAGVKNVVNLSSLGAEQATGTGPILGLHDQEQRLNKLPGVNIVHLRPAYFFENVLFGLELVRNQAIYGTPVDGNVAFAQVATQDIAARAHALLAGMASCQGLAKRGRTASEFDFHGIQIVEVLGPDELTLAEVGRLTGEAFGKQNLPYVQFPEDAARQAMVAGGLSADVAEMFLQLYDSLNKGRIATTLGRSHATSSKTSFGQFVKSLV